MSNLYSLFEEIKPCEGVLGPCEAAGIERSCRTKYHDEEMNKNPILCERCAEYYSEYWDDMWREYYSSVI